MSWKNSKGKNEGIKLNPELEQKFAMALTLDGGKSQEEVLEKLIGQYVSSVFSKVANNLANEDPSGRKKETVPEPYSVPKKYLVPQRIAGVARNPGQINHQILKAFFHCEVNGKASRSKMMEYFLSIRPGATAWKFENNFNQMTTDEGNPHGHYFDCHGDVVTLFAPVAAAIMEYEKAFR